MGLKISLSRRSAQTRADHHFVLNFRIETISLEQGKGPGPDRHLTRLRLVGKGPHKANGRTRMIGCRKTVRLFNIAHFSQFVRPKCLSSAGFKPFGLVDKNVFWQVGSSATLGTGTAFAGNILALTSITMNTGAGISCGSALARNGAVTLDNNVIGGGCGGGGGGGTTVPEPGTISLMGSGLIILAGVARRRLRI
jgi:Ice-binding-like/PEP-CTERM motif